MFSIQEICDKFKMQLKSVRDSMDAKAEFHPDDASVYNGLNLVEQQSLRETLQAIPYSKLREYLSRGTTIGNYLAADKVYDDIVAYSATADICPLISAQMVNGWPGGDLIVNVSDDESFKAWEFVSGGLLPTETIGTGAKATLSPISFGIAPRIGDDLVEDTSFNGDLIQWHLKRAAFAIGEKASDLAVTVLKGAADGVGTLNSGNAGADTTTWANLETALAANTDDHWISNTILINPEAWEDSVKKDIGTETAGGAGGDYWQPYAEATLMSNQPVSAGFDFRISTLDFKLYICPANHAAGDTTAMTDCVTVVFDRNNALLTGRKRWMAITNYAEPIRGLAGCVISCRQDSVSLYDDAVYTLTET